MKNLLWSSFWRRMFQTSAQREADESAKVMIDELIELAQGEWSRQLYATLEIPDLITSPAKYAYILKGREMMEIKTAFLCGHLYENSKKYNYPTNPEMRAFTLLIELLRRDGMAFEKARQEVIAFRRVIENDDDLTTAIYCRGQASAKDPTFHPHLPEILIHMTKLNGSPTAQS